MDSPRPVDRFGWYTDGDYVMSSKEKQLADAEAKKEHSREQKWAEMTSNWEYWISHKRDKVARRIRKGIPDSFRSKAWDLLTNAEASLIAAPESIEQLMQKPELPVYKSIAADVQRTFTHTAYFSNPEMQQSLKKVLCSFAQINPELGYVFGMSNIAATFLMYLDENTTLWAFYNVLMGFRTLHRDYYTTGTPRWKLANQMLDILLKDKLPKIHKHFHDINLDLKQITAKWFIPAFLNYEWPSEFMLRIFDIFLFYGTRALLVFAISIFWVHREELITDSLADVITLMDNLDSSTKLKDWRVFLKNFDDLWINKKYYLSLLKQCGAPPERLE